MTVAAVVEVQAENLLWSGGRLIGKDFTPFSWDHLTHTVLSLEIAGVWYGLVALAAYAAVWVVRSVHLRRLFWFAVIGTAISAVSLVGFTYLATSAMPDRKHAAEVFYVVGMGALFWCVSRSGGFVALLRLAVVMAVVAVVELQAFQLFWSGTIGKDFGPFTWGHLTHTVWSLGIIGACYGVLAVIIHTAAWVVRSVRLSRAQVTKLVWFAVVGVAVIAVSERGYMWLAGSTTPDAKYGVVVFYGVATVGLIWHASRSYDLATLVALAAALTLVSVVEFQAFQFWRSESDLRGTTPFTWDRLNDTVSFSLPVIVAWYGLVVVAAHAARRVGRWGAPSTGIEAASV
jgi:hypothetical protein